MSFDMGFAKLFQDLDSLVGKEVSITVSSRRPFNLELRGTLRNSEAEHYCIGEVPDRFFVKFSRNNVNVVDVATGEINISLV